MVSFAPTSFSPSAKTAGPSFAAAPATSPLVAVTSGQSVVSWDTFTPDYILSLGQKEEEALKATLRQYLGKVDKTANPNIFKLVDRLMKGVEDANLEQVADAVLNSKPSLYARFIGLFSKAKLEQAMQDAFMAASDLTSQKSKGLQVFMDSLEKELKAELEAVKREILMQESLRQEYMSAATAFDVAVTQSKEKLEQLRMLPLDDPNDPGAKHTRSDILVALESRIGALDETATRLPAEIEIARNLMVAGFQTVQEVSTTANSKFISIMSTLLSLSAALRMRGAQETADRNAKLDQQLTAVRSRVTKQVVVTAAEMIGNNRLQAANQLRSIIADTVELSKMKQAAMAANTAKLQEADRIRSESKMLLSNELSS